MALFERHRRLHKRHLFDDLPFEAQQEAQQRLCRYCKRWEGDLPSFRLAILIGQARRWTMTSEEERSQWGRTMLAKRCGYAVQRKDNRIIGIYGAGDGNQTRIVSETAPVGIGACRWRD